jgi:hypothetical protein
MWDVFISHASEDKTAVVRPLAAVLESLGLSVWVDEFELTIGDSLRRKIDDGLGQSRYGVVVLSHAFFSKEWPQKELDALVARETFGEKVILPVWHELRREDVARYSPLLADRWAAQTVRGIDAVAHEIASVCVPGGTGAAAVVSAGNLPPILDDMRHHGIWHHYDATDAKGMTWSAVASEAARLNFNYDFVVHFLRLKNASRGWYVEEYAGRYVPCPIPSLRDFIEILEVRRQHLQRVLDTSDLKTEWEWPESWGRVLWSGPVVHVFPDNQGYQPPDQRYLEETQVELERTVQAIEQSRVLLSAAS